ncbi:hypothetical protein THC_1470 [Caldimicrobium thiodismutans]|uniref:Uncharacterized protein n=1 Tax=Caldimicrobium thiodismutans TaxID=1653476 RepID=A0A0U4W418_9BACT|nr:hypothetical protein THC_1470 [Caldimicrobium thiodismutans]
MPVKVKYTPICERNTDKNVCTTTDPQKKFKGYKILNPYYLSLKRPGRTQEIDILRFYIITLQNFIPGGLKWLD